VAASCLSSLTGMIRRPHLRHRSHARLRVVFGPTRQQATAEIDWAQGAGGGLGLDTGMRSPSACLPSLPTSQASGKPYDPKTSHHRWGKSWQADSSY
jgi:hypothetical protein